MSIINAKDALLTRLASIADPWPTVYENQEFEPPENGSWQMPLFIFDGPEAMGWGAESVEEWKGIMQVNLFAPRGSFAMGVEQKAEAIRAHFPRSLNLSNDGFTVTILNVKTHHGMNDGRWFHMPVSIYWHSYTYSTLPS